MVRHETFTHLISSGASWTKDHSGTILTVATVVGVVATNILTANATFKAATDLNDKKRRTNLEKVQKVAHHYIPSVVVGGLTIVACVASDKAHRSKEIALASACTAIQQSFDIYKRETEKVLTEDQNFTLHENIANERVDETMLNDIPKEKALFVEEFSGRSFYSTIEDVQAAEYELNRTFVLSQQVELNTFYRYLGIPTVDYGEELGWDIYWGEAYYGYQWIDFRHRKVLSKDGKQSYYVIEYPFSPHIISEDPTEGSVSFNEELKIIERYGGENREEL